MNKTVFIGYPKCSTCKKCYQALQDLGIDAEYRDIKHNKPTKEEIKSWISKGVSLNKLFNTSGQLYRQQNIKEKRKNSTDEQLIDILAGDGMMVKRPIVIQGNTIIVGNRISEYELLKNDTKGKGC